jgi:glycosyltransferase involved in cell wall biosynthesis
MNSISSALTPLAPLTPPTPLLRIAVVTETYAPEINGVAHTMKHVVEALLEQGHTVELTRPRQTCDQKVSVVGEHASADAPMPQPNFDLRLVHGQAIPRYKELQLGLSRPNTFFKQWQKSRPDVVHVVTEGPLGWAAVIAARRLRIPVSSGFHTNFQTYSSHYGIGVFANIVDAALRALHNRCQLTMVPTAQMRQALLLRGYENLAVIGRGIDTVLFNPGRRNQALRTIWGADDDAPVLLYVGRLAPEKNLQLFVDAAQKFRSANPRAKVVLVGSGPDAAAMKAAHPDFIFMGIRTGIDLAVQYASADVFLFPSVTETFGNVTLEALASGLAVVAYDYAAARQHIVHKKSGHLVPFDDAVSFINTANELAQSPTRVAALRQHACAATACLSWDTIGHDFAKTLCEAIHSYQSGSRAIELAEAKPLSHSRPATQSASLPT